MKLLFLVFAVLLLPLFMSRGVVLDVEPKVFSSCDQPTNTSVVTWSVTRKDVTSLSVFVNAVNAKETLWGATNDLEGTLTTGPWVSDGLTFTLRDQAGNVLAKKTIQTTRCLTNDNGQ